MRARPNETGFSLLQTTRVGLATALWKTAGAEEAVPAFEAVIAQWDAVGEREPRRTDALFERAALRAEIATYLTDVADQLAAWGFRPPALGRVVELERAVIVRGRTQAQVDRQRVSATEK